ncbi:MAG TPA: thiamine pyrophosphate-dependent enzyme, partial [Lutibacter sp.]|nr:thiamine pyrophosphate-dependent enzyme [Lutibacter sp.]
MIISVWDDDYGISVPAKYQTTKESISEILKGFQRDETSEGFEIFVVKGWDYPQLIAVYNKAAKIAREEHVPVLIHVKDLTQPQGHSTSGSHERYKTKERLIWEKQNDCLAKMRDWIIEFELKDSNNNLLRFVDSEEELIVIEKDAKKEVNQARRDAWNAFLNPVKEEKAKVLQILENLANKSHNKPFILKLKNDLSAVLDTSRKDLLVAARKAVVYVREEKSAEKSQLQQWIVSYLKKEQQNFSSFLYSQSDKKVSHVKEVLPTYDANAEMVDGRI